MTEHELKKCRERLERYWAKRLPEGNAQAMQQMVGQSPWEWTPVWERPGQRMTAELEAEPVWVVDDTDFPKQGRHSVGVALQYSGTLGKTGNCQVAVSLHHGGEQGSAVLGWRLYLPENWIKDPERRWQAGIPEDVSFKTKWQLALELIDQSRGRGLPSRIVVGDAGYGDATDLRDALESREIPYVLGISSQAGVWAKPPKADIPADNGKGRRPIQYDYGKQRPTNVQELALKTKGWKTIRWREGSKGWLKSRFVAIRTRPSHGCIDGHPPHKEVWLLLEWPEGEEGPTKSYFCDLPSTSTLRRFVRLAKSGWKIEQDYQQLKEELGLDHYEGRGWNGWYHHVTLVMMAHAFPILENIRLKKTSGWTLPQTRREIQYLLFTWTGFCAFCGQEVRPREKQYPHYLT